MTRIETAKVVHGPAWQAFSKPACHPRERLDVAMGQLAYRITSAVRENKKISKD